MMFKVKPVCKTAYSEFETSGPLVSCIAPSGILYLGNVWTFQVGL